MMNGSSTLSRRKWLASAFMGAGLALSYGVLALQGFLYLLPEQRRARTRKIFAGRIDDFSRGDVRAVYDLQGNQVLVRRGAEGLQAFSTVCPHLGCRVHWDAANERFFCPCHRGEFDRNGIATAGPPADAGQRLGTVPITLDEKGGVVYLEVTDVRKG